MRALAFVFVLLTLAIPALIVVGVPYLVVYPDKYEIEMTPEKVGLEFEDLTIQPADVPINLAGWWMPAESPTATMLFIHGGNSNRHSSYFRALEFYKAMVDRGVNVMAIDLRNHGSSDDTPEGIQFGGKEWHDVIAALEWLDQKGVAGPIVTMGISMGGATIVHAAAKKPDLKTDGLILLDPLLDTINAGANAIRAEANLPLSLGGFAMWGAQTFYGMPAGAEDALALGALINQQTLLVQDPHDPVTRASYSQRLADSNENVTIWYAPAADPTDPRLQWKGAWGSHVSAFELFPDETLGQITDFIDSLK